ncbi:MAG: hypothetical protein LBF43_04305, partial [Puniceicoccales bacterium]|nr:hypothetical protein [Puniceicoccales bacterium]
ESDVDSDDEDNFVQEMARRRRARVQGREDKIFSHLRRHGSVAELNQFVRKTQRMLSDRGLRMAIGQGGYYEVIPEENEVPQGFRLLVIPGEGQRPGPALPRYWEVDFDDPQLGCHHPRLGCDHRPPPPSRRY